MDLPQDQQLEDYIDMNVIVDCSDEHEVVSSWYCFLFNHLHFPFIAKTSQSQSLNHDKVTVMRLMVEGDCKDDIWGKIEDSHGFCSILLSSLSS